MKKIFPLSIAVILFFAILAITATADYEIKDINVPVGECIVDGIIEPGEWDAATGIVLDYAVAVDRARPEQRREDYPEELSTAVKIKVKGDYLYIMEDRKNPNIKFYHDNPMYSYENNGGIVFFFVDGTAQRDLFYMAGTKSDPTKPAFCFRPDNSNDDRVILSPAESATIVTEGVGCVFEAKIKLSDIGMTLADFESGNTTMYSCSTQIWGDNYNDQYAKSVGVDPAENTATLGFWEWAIPDADQQPGFAQTDTPAWAASGNFITVADTFDADAFRAAQAAAEAPAEATSAEAVPVEAATAAPAPAATAAPQTGDTGTGMILAVLALLASTSVLVYKTKKKQSVIIKL